MPTTPDRPPRPGLRWPVGVDTTGRWGPTPGQARGPRWRRTSPGLYVPVGVAASTEQRIVEAAAGLPLGAAVTGWAALHWRGAHWFSGLAGDGQTPIPVPVMTTSFRRPQPGVVVSQEFCAPAQVELVDGIPVTSAARSVTFTARYARSITEAVTALDMAAFADLVELDELRRYAAALGPLTGIGRLREALALADENAWSPAEVGMRLVWAGSGRGPLICNTPIFDLAGRHLATPDVLDPVAGVAGEYESALHLLGSRRAADVRREGILLRHGVEMVTMVATDRQAPAEFLQRLDDAYRRAGRRPPERTWTVVPPPWWTPTVTVAQRRALTAYQRERLLRHRRAG